MPSVAGVPGNALPISGALDLATINAEFGLGTDLTLYHGARWYYDGNLTTGVFNSSTLKVSDFYGKRATDPANNGSYFSSAAGSGTFTVPLYRNTITIEFWGAGGGGGGNGSSGGYGGDSNMLGITAGGGQGGGAGHVDLPGPPLDVSVSGHGGSYTYTDTSYTSQTLNAYAGNKDGVWSESQNNATGQGSNPTASQPNPNVVGTISA